MTQEQIDALNTAIQNIAAQMAILDNQSKNLVAYVNDTASYNSITGDDLKNAYTSIATFTSFLNNGVVNQGNWRGNVNKVLKGPIV